MKRKVVRNDDEQPIVDWESPELRFRLAADVQEIIGAPRNIIRVAKDVRVKIEQHYSGSGILLGQAGEIVNSWDAWVVLDRGSPPARWGFLKIMHLPNWNQPSPLIVIFGRDRAGS